MTLQGITEAVRLPADPLPPHGLATPVGFTVPANHTAQGAHP